MIGMKFSIGLQYEVLNCPADFIFNVHAAETAGQRIVTERLSISQNVHQEMYVDPFYGTRYLRLNAQPGPLSLEYEATVEIVHAIADPSQLHEVPIAQLPLEIMRYIYPSRYCQSDRLGKFALQAFGHVPPGFTRVQAMIAWILERTTFQSGTTNSSTSATDTLLEQRGVCRDFAHLLIALCRALNIPARFVTGIDYGADPALGPCDFHAYVEVYLSGRWYLFDPSGVSIPMGLVRMGTGRDAADVAFATVFGAIHSWSPKITIDPIHDPANGYDMPTHTAQALCSC